MDFGGCESQAVRVNAAARSIVRTGTSVLLSTYPIWVQSHGHTTHLFRRSSSWRHLRRLNEPPWSDRAPRTWRADLRKLLSPTNNLDGLQRFEIRRHVRGARSD